MKTTDYIEYLDDTAILFDGCCSAIVGCDQNGFAVYDFTKLVQIFEADGMTSDEAEEWADFNILGVLPQKYTILYTQ